MMSTQDLTVVLILIKALKLFASIVIGNRLLMVVTHTLFALIKPLSRVKVSPNAMPQIVDVVTQVPILLPMEDKKLIVERTTSIAAMHLVIVGVVALNKSTVIVADQLVFTNTKLTAITILNTSHWVKAVLGHIAQVEVGNTQVKVVVIGNTSLARVEEHTIVAQLLPSISFAECTEVKLPDLWILRIKQQGGRSVK